MEKTNIHLLDARFAKALTISDVEHLLGHKSLGLVGRIERGRMPSLKTAIKLEIIYGRPLAALFPEVYRVCKEEVAKARISALQRRPGSGGRS